MYVPEHELKLFTLIAAWNNLVVKMPYKDINKRKEWNRKRYSSMMEYARSFKKVFLLWI